MIINQVAYRLKAGKWTSKQRMPFIEAEMMHKQLKDCFSNLVIVAERE